MLWQAILETTAVVLLAVLFAGIGIFISRKKSRAWLFSFLGAFPFILFVILMNRTPVLFYQLGLSRLTEGRNEYVIMAVTMPFIFGLLIPRLTVRRQRIAIGLFAALCIAYFSLPPFLDPVLLYHQMANNETQIEDDVCLQSTGYTCGAASAVTALKCFGIDADERRLAYASHTSRIWGTTQYMLADAIEQQFADQGIHCQVRTFETIDDMQACCPVIMIIHYKAMLDHFVTVLAVDNKKVLIGDPLSGRERLSHTEFEKKWRKIGIVLTRTPAN